MLESGFFVCAAAVYSGALESELLVPRAGVEPATSPLGGERSIQLSYRGVAGSIYDPIVWRQNHFYVEELRLFARDSL